MARFSKTLAPSSGGAHAAPQTIPLCIEQRSPLDQRQHIRTGLAEGAHDQAPDGAKLLHAPFDRALRSLRSPVPPPIDLASLGIHFPVDRTRSPGDRSVPRIQYGTVLVPYNLRAQCLLKPEPCDLTFFGENGKVRYSLNSRKFTRKFEIHIYSLGKRV